MQGFRSGICYSAGPESLASDCGYSSGRGFVFVFDFFCEVNIRFSAKPDPDS